MKPQPPLKLGAIAAALFATSVAALAWDAGLIAAPMLIISLCILVLTVLI